MAKAGLESLVADRLRAIRDEIVDLAASNEGTPGERRRKALALFDDLDVGQRMLANAQPQRIVGGFTEDRDPSEAVVAYLEQRGKPATIAPAVFLLAKWRSGRGT